MIGTKQWERKPGYRERRKRETQFRREAKEAYQRLHGGIEWLYRMAHNIDESSPLTEEETELILEVTNKQWELQKYYS